jgi:hypothetical protein
MHSKNPTRSNRFSFLATNICWIFIRRRSNHFNSKSSRALNQIMDIFSSAEKRNLLFYCLGIMSYKFSLDSLNTCVFNLLSRSLDAPNASVLWVLLQSCNYGTQCLGSLLVAPAVRDVRSSRLLAATIIAYAATISVVPLFEVSSGGTFTDAADWDPWILFVVFPMAGLFQGVVELIRRVIPSDIVGGNEVKLKKMDSSVHVLYEVSGTIGPILATYWMRAFGYAYALFVMAVTLSIACGFFLFVRLDAPVRRANEGSRVRSLVAAFFKSIWIGAKLVFTTRSLIWLIPAYSLPLVVHRYAENTVMQFYARDVLGDGTLGTVLVAGSNAGELCGALSVFFLASKVLFFMLGVRSRLTYFLQDQISNAVVKIGCCFYFGDLGFGLRRSNTITEWLVVMLKRMSDVRVCRYNVGVGTVSSDGRVIVWMGEW